MFHPEPRRGLRTPARYNDRVDFNPNTPRVPAEWDPPLAPGFGTRLARFVGEVLQTLVVGAILFLGVNLVTARIRVEGSSMEPTLHDAELVVVNRLGYSWADAG